MPRIGPMELIIVLLIVLLVFGAAKLPEIGGALGKSIHNFRKAASTEDEDKSKDDKASQKSGDTKS